MIKLLAGDCLTVLPTLSSSSVHCCISSPPYWGLRDYGVEGQLGLEKSPNEYVDKLVAIFREVRRALRDDGTLWLNLGDTYSNAGTRQGDRDGTITQSGDVNHQRRSYRPTAPDLKNKDLCMIPARVAIALQADGWYLRSDIIWSKPNPMPESVSDRPTKAHEYIFLLAKSPRYYYDGEAIAEPATSAEEARWDPGDDGLSGEDRKTGKSTRRFKAGRSGNLERKFRGDFGGIEGSKANQGFAIPWEGLTRNRRSVWTVPSQPYKGAHFATFPPRLVEPCILAGSSRQTCEQCGAPWERVIQRTALADVAKGLDNPLPKKRARQAMGLDGGARSGLSASNSHNASTPSCGVVKTLGWAASCHCEGTSGTGSSTILDPFAGAGTTGLVADRLGRDSVLVELNPDYVALIRERITSDAPLFVRVEGE